MRESDNKSMEYSQEAWRARQIELRKLVGYFQDGVDSAIMRDKPEDQAVFWLRRAEVVKELDQSYPEDSVINSHMAHYAGRA